MKKIFLLIAFCIMTFASAEAQVKVTYVEGLAFYNMSTTQLSSLSVKKKGDTYFDVTQGVLVYWDGASFVPLNGGTGISPADQTKLNNIVITQSVNLDDIESKANSALQSFTETDPTVTPSSIKTDLETLTGSLRLDASAIKNISASETDPVFAASQAFGITSTNKNNWNSAFGWGDHSVEGYATLIGNNPFSGANTFSQQTTFNAQVNVSGLQQMTGTSATMHFFPNTVTNTIYNNSYSRLFADADGDLTWFPANGNIVNKYGFSFQSDNTANRVYTLPDKPGTIAMLSDVAGYVTSVAGKTGAVTLVKDDITDLQVALDGKLNLSGGTMTGAINLGGNNITSVGSIDASGSITSGSNLLVGNSVSFLPSGGLTTIAGRNETGFLTGNVFSWKQTDAEHEAQFNFNGLTADRVFTLPDTPGTFALTSQLGTANSVTSAMIVDGTIANADLDTATKSSLTKADKAILNDGNPNAITQSFGIKKVATGTGLNIAFPTNETTITGGDSAASSQVDIVVGANKADVFGLSNAEIITSGAASIITKSYGDAYYLGGKTAATTTYDNTTSGMAATDVQNAVNELITASPLQITASRPLETTDLNRVLYSSTGTELDVTVNSGIGKNGDVVVLMPLTTNSVIRFFPGTATFLNVLKTLTTVGAKLVYQKINGSWIGDPRDGTVYIPCSADPNQKVTTANAASDPNCNEANTIDGWLKNDAGVTVASVTDSDKGTYAISVQSTSIANKYGYYTIVASAGHTFSYSFRAKATVGTNGQYYITGAGTSPVPGGAITSSSWTTYSGTLTATGTMIFRFFPDNESGAVGAIGDTFIIDDFSVIKTN